MRRKSLVISATAIITILILVVSVLTAGRLKVERAGAAWEAGRYGSASEAFAQAAGLLPWRKDLWEKAGIAAGLNDDFPAAIAYIERSDEHSEQGWLVLGYAYFKSGDVPAALNAYREGLRVYDSFLLYNGLRAVHASEQDRPAEREVLEQLVRLQPQDAFSQYRLGLLLTVLSPEQALPPLLEAGRLDPQYDPAVQTLRAALDLKDAPPDRSRQMVSIGRALGLVEEWELAVEAFRLGVDLDPLNAEAWAWLGEAQQQSGVDGRASLDRALSLDHTSANVRALRGLYWSRQGRYSQMLAEYLLAAEYEPGNPAWRASIGEAYRLRGDLAAAADAYRKAVELAPAESTYWRLLAVFCGETGVYLEETGLPAAQKAVELAPQDPQALDALGLNYYATGRFSNAEKTLTRAIELSSEYLPAQYHLALTHLAQAKRSEAYELLTHIRETDPHGLGELADDLLQGAFP
jgi:tetratricopeptide (TPR) repeat protein